MPPKKKTAGSAKKVPPKKKTGGSAKKGGNAGFLPQSIKGMTRPVGVAPMSPPGSPNKLPGPRHGLHLVEKKGNSANTNANIANTRMNANPITRNNTSRSFELKGNRIQV